MMAPNQSGSEHVPYGLVPHADFVEFIQQDQDRALAVTAEMFLLSREPRPPGYVPGPRLGAEQCAKRIVINGRKWRLIYLIHEKLRQIEFGLLFPEGEENPPDRPVQTIPGQAAQYDLAAIRQLLLAGFTPETLRRFCQDRRDFRPIVSDFGPGQSLNTMIDRVVDYCETQALWAEFLAEVKRKNPNQYARFESDLYGR
jgi:hypothetical protein